MISDRTASAGSNTVINAAREGIMAIARHIGSLEHHDDPDTGLRRFVLTIDLLGVTVAGLLSLLAVRFLRRVWERALRNTT